VPDAELPAKRIHLGLAPRAGTRDEEFERVRGLGAAVVAGTTSAPVIDLELVADRPFRFVIHDLAHGTPLFLGRVLLPRG